MTVEINTSLGKIDVSQEVISMLVGRAAMDGYGIVGMASQSALKDGIIEILGRENLGRGVDIQSSEDGLNIDLYIIVRYGTRISEVARNVQQKVGYSLNETLGIDAASINIFVQGVKVEEGE